MKVIVAVDVDVANQWMFTL